MNKYNADVVIIGVGIAGITAAIELMNNGYKVILLDRDNDKELGRLAKLGRTSWTKIPQ
jgi:heterodisulfide reductase subunit A-like polyferredoxin